MRVRLTTSLGAVLSLLSAACGGSKSAIDNTAATLDQQVFDSTLHVNLAASTRTGDGLYYRDLQVGTGSDAKNGNTLDVLYTLWLPDGTKMESLVAGQQPYQFTLGKHAVIDGWDEGLVGMRAGGVRQLIIPSELAYGPAGFEKIPPGANLVFTVELVSVQ